MNGWANPLMGLSALASQPSCDQPAANRQGAPHLRSAKDLPISDRNQYSTTSTAHHQCRSTNTLAPTILGFKTRTSSGIRLADIWSETSTAHLACRSTKRFWEDTSYTTNTRYTANKQKAQCVSIIKHERNIDNSHKQTHTNAMAFKSKEQDC